MAAAGGSGGVQGIRRRTVVMLAGALAVVVALLGSVTPSQALAPRPDTPEGGRPEGSCAAGLGPYQRQLEEHLGLEVDGRQSAADCDAIRAFQERHGVEPADGYAGIPTYRTMLVVVARENPNEQGACTTGPWKVVCVDLTRQLLWVQEGEAGSVLLDPVPIRTGRQGLETRLGWHEIYLRKRDHYSTIYDNAPMPYAQFFDGGQAFHGTYDDLYESGSGGCVNLRLPDAERLWQVVDRGDLVFVYGEKPGTGDGASAAGEE